MERVGALLNEIPGKFSMANSFPPKASIQMGSATFGAQAEKRNIDGKHGANGMS